MSEIKQVSKASVEPISSQKKGAKNIKTDSVVPPKEDRISISVKGKDENKKELSKMELFEKIDFKDGSKENLELFRELVKMRMKSGFYGKKNPVSERKSAIEIAKQMAGRSLPKNKTN